MRWRINTETICIDKKKYAFNFLRLMYEKFYNEKLTSSDIIRLKNDTNENKFHYENLKKINRKDMIKNENHNELDNTKEWKITKNYPDYKISNLGDNYEQLKVAIGQSQQGILSSSLAFLNCFVGSYEARITASFVTASNWAAVNVVFT